MDRPNENELQTCIDRMRAGDGTAKAALIAHTYERMRGLARTILHQSFPRLEHVHSTGTVLHEAVIRLLKDLDKLPVKTERDFYSWSAELIRRTLIDLARKHDRRGAKEVPLTSGSGDSSQVGSQGEPVAPADDPVDRAIGAECYALVQKLPKHLQEVFDLHVVQGLTQEETARILGISQATVSNYSRAIVPALGDLLIDSRT